MLFEIEAWGMLRLHGLWSPKELLSIPEFDNSCVNLFEWKNIIIL